MRIYLDTAPIIYIVEQVLPYRDALDKRLVGSGIVLVTSDMSRLECRVKPLRDNNVSLLADYDIFFQNAIQETVLLSKDVIDRATEIRATYGFSTPDAIHLAAATIAKCDSFLTNDLILKKYAAMIVETVQ